MGTIYIGQRNDLMVSNKKMNLKIEIILISTWSLEVKEIFAIVKKQSPEILRLQQDSNHSYDNCCRASRRGSILILT